MKQEICIALFDTIADAINRAEPTLMATARSGSQGYSINEIDIFYKYQPQEATTSHLRILTFKAEWGDRDEDLILYAEPRETDLGLDLIIRKHRYRDTFGGITRHDRSKGNCWQYHFKMNIYEFNADEVTSWCLDLARTWLLKRMPFKSRNEKSAPVCERKIHV